MRFNKRYFSFYSFLFSFLICKGSYFQQEVNYTIHVTLNDKTHELSAEETFVYKNNSSVTLKEIYVHLWPAAYSGKNTVLANEIYNSGDSRMLEASEKKLGNIDSLDFKVNNEKVKWNVLEDTVDVCRIILNKPLNPGDSISISTPFRIKIPSALLSRMGRTGQTYYITQWYPKPAVYDENGWNYFPYLDQGEYYSEFGTYDVYISLPENYLLASTGVIVDNEKEKEWLNKNDSLTRALKYFPEKDSTPPSSKIFKTIHFHHDRIHDFAWFADKSWHVLKDTVLLPQSNRSITTFSFFNSSNAENWKKSPELIKDAIHFYSNYVGEYPYDNYSIVDVGYAMTGAMEYPMVSTIPSSSHPLDIEVDIVHEAGHNWFYGILGNNERCNAWMDEGINDFYENRYIYTKYKNDSSNELVNRRISLQNKTIKYQKVIFRKLKYYGYLSSARFNSDQPPQICSDKISIQNYHADIYFKTSLSLEYLKSYLGDSLFDVCMKKYFVEWKFKHPQPEDLKNIFEKTTSKNLDWLFSDLINSTKKLDYKITSIQSKNNTSREIEIKNNGDIKGPVSISQLRNKNIITTNWLEGFEGKTKITLPCDDCDEYKIDAEERMPDINESNNSIRTSGILKKMEKIKFSFGTSLDNGSITSVYFSPVVGWNNYNKLMAGLVLHNISMYEKKFEYRLMPLYAIGTNDIAGGGDFSYHFYLKDFSVYRITLRTGISSYAFGNDSYNSPSGDFHYANILHYTKLDSKIIFSFKQKDMQKHFSNELILRNVLINRDIPYFIDYKEQSKIFSYWQAVFVRKNSNPLEASMQKINLTLSKGFLKATVEATSFLCYGQPKKGMGIRFFGGFTTIPSQGTYGIDYRMNLSGRAGTDDYLFDEVFLGRTEDDGILSQQFVNDYEGFKTPTSFYRLAQKWMAGLNINTTLPGFLPFRLFANTGIFDNSDEDGTYSKISWELGVDLPLIKDIFIISLPFAYSNDIEYAIDQQGYHTGDLIRFELHLNLLNPLNMIKSVYAE